MSVMAYLTRDEDTESVDLWIGHKPVFVAGEFVPRTARGKFMRMADEHVVALLSKETGYHISEGEIWEFTLSASRKVPSDCERAGTLFPIEA